jgi:hypothetical protein
LDRLCTAQLHLLRLGYHCTFASSSVPALCNAYATYATVAHLAPYHTPQAPEARTFPCLTRHSHAIHTSSAVYCHHQFTPSRHPEGLFSLESHVHALPLRKAQCSHASRAYVALFTRPRHVTLASSQSSPYHSGSHHHHIPELLLCLHAPESLRTICCSTTLSHPYGALRLRFPTPFAFLARHSYASLASSHSPQTRLHDTH